MKTHVQVAVIGGGIVGASVLYWLAKMGWADSLLLERRELTSGSTWHAAGNTTYFGPYPAMTQLFAGSIRTYLQAQEESGQDIGFHQTGSLRLAATRREAELFQSFRARYKELGIPFHVRSNEEVNQLHPFINTDETFGAAHTPTDGHVDPVSTTHSLVAAAKKCGAAVEKYNPVVKLQPNVDGWTIETEKGSVCAQHVVVATSFWAREMLQPLGINVPLYATEHHEIITEPIPGVAATKSELPAMRDSHISCNVRQERDALLIGIYEKEPVFWALDGIPEDFKEELLVPNIDRLLPHLELLAERLPIFGEAGFKTINNGPMCFTPDGLPMLGPLPQCKNLWMASGFNVGIGTGGGSAEFLAHWMTTGKPMFDLKAVHADRFGNEMSMETALNAIREVYARGYELPEAI